VEIAWRLVPSVKLFCLLQPLLVGFAAFFGLLQLDDSRKDVDIYVE
jgi:hypothetical protein